MALHQRFPQRLSERQLAIQKVKDTADGLRMLCQVGQFVVPLIMIYGAFFNVMIAMLLLLAGMTLPIGSAIHLLSVRKYLTWRQCREIVRQRF